jgi:NADH-quinone oxidoreductase subunit K
MDINFLKITFYITISTLIGYQSKKYLMYKIQIITNIILFLSGSLGILTNKKNILVILMCIEILLLSVNLNFITFSNYLDDFVGQIFSLFILTVAAGESAIGLAILILFFRIHTNIAITELKTLKG